ncbi:MAG: hypothetical protein COB78_12015 [Hyphomicrobiales bacterium]|nr:MAG: hypothetical protein COB78_12015 [Hyphomicrobiales bacterium]
MAIILRNKICYLKGWFPKQFSRVERHKEVWISLETDHLAIAEKKAPLAWETHLDAWTAKVDGDTSDGEEFFDAAKKLAQEVDLKIRAALLNRHAGILNIF